MDSASQGAVLLAKKRSRPPVKNSRNTNSMPASVAHTSEVAMVCCLCASVKKVKISLLVNEMTNFDQLPSCVAATHIMRALHVKKRLVKTEKCLCELGHGGENRPNESIPIPKSGGGASKPQANAYDCRRRRPGL